MIQAGHLVQTEPETALGLIDDYFALNDESMIAMAWCVRARAQERLGRIVDAVSSFKRTLDWELAHPNSITNARLDYPQFVAENGLREEYALALTVHVERFKPNEFAFPVQLYRWYGCQALIRASLGEMVDARYFAERALVAASATQSKFRYHRDIGVVGTTDDVFGRRVKRLARRPFLRRVLDAVR